MPDVFSCFAFEFVLLLLSTSISWRNLLCLNCAPSYPLSFWRMSCATEVAQGIATFLRISCTLYFTIPPSLFGLVVPSLSSYTMRAFVIPRRCGACSRLLKLRICGCGLKGQTSYRCSSVPCRHRGHSSYSRCGSNTTPSVRERAKRRLQWRWLGGA